MATRDQNREFDEIVKRLTTPAGFPDPPALPDDDRRTTRPLRRPVKIGLAVGALLLWGLLSVAMVRWGWLVVVVVALTVAVTTRLLATAWLRRRRAHRRRARPDLRGR